MSRRKHSLSLLATLSNHLEEILLKKNPKVYPAFEKSNSSAKKIFKGFSETRISVQQAGENLSIS